MGDSLVYLNPLKDLLSQRQNKLLAFVGNEYNMPSNPISKRIQFLSDINADFIATQLPLSAGEWLYAQTKAKVLAIPHALNPNAFSVINNNNNRPIDIGVRNYRYPVYLGDNERNGLIDNIKKLKTTNGLKLDINFEQRLNRKDWNIFLNNSKSTIASEAGTYYLQIDDKTVLEVYDYLQTNNKKLTISTDKLLLRKIINSLPINLKANLKRLLKYMFFTFDNVVEVDAKFNEVYDKFFKNLQPCPVHSKCISSRHFDAAGTKTLQILYPGEYNGILKADLHYLCLAKDFSNIDEVLTKLNDRSFVNAMIDTTYDYVMSMHTYEKRIKDLFNSVF